MSKHDAIRLARDRIENNRYLSQNTFEQHTLEAKLKIAGFEEIDKKISSIGPRIMGISLGHKTSDSIEMLQAEYNSLVQEKQDLLEKSGYPRDFCDIKYYCEKCGDTGYVGINICDCLKQEIINAYFEMSGLYNLAETQSFETFSLEYYKDNALQYMKINLDKLKDFVKNFIPGKSDSFLFVGGTGLGKTHLSTAIAKQLISKGHNVIYTTSINLFTEFENVHFNRSGLTINDVDLDKYYDADLLIIDDLGCEMTTSYTISVLYDIINRRILKHQSTIISTNLLKDDLRKRYSDRILSRLFGEYKLLLFLGNDVREQKLGKNN